MDLFLKKRELIIVAGYFKKNEVPLPVSVIKQDKKSLNAFKKLFLKQSRLYRDFKPKKVDLILPEEWSEEVFDEFSISHATENYMTETFGAETFKNKKIEIITINEQGWLLAFWPIV